MAEAACRLVQQSQATPILNSFYGRPPGALERFPSGGAELTDLLAFILIVDPKGGTDPVAKLARSASFAQRQAIGAAFGTAVEACRRNGDSIATEKLEKAVSGLGDTTVGAAFQARLSEVSRTGTGGSGAPVVAPDREGPRRRIDTGPTGSAFAPRPLGDPLRPLAPIR